VKGRIFNTKADKKTPRYPKLTKSNKPQSLPKILNTSQHGKLFCIMKQTLYVAYSIICLERESTNSGVIASIVLKIPCSVIA